jgi:hypothetical protein
MRCALLLAIALTFVLSGPAQAFGPRARVRPPVYLQQQGAYGRVLYPQYYGGIHAHQLQSIGIPSGDIGLRGNGGVGWGAQLPW